MTPQALKYYVAIEEVESEYESIVEAKLQQDPTVPKRIVALTTIRQMLHREVEVARKVGAALCF